SEVTVDVRIVAATNRDLEREVRAERFRKDLFFRLGARLYVPPLRDHKEDIPELAASFLDRFNHQYRKKLRLAPEALEHLREYTWPGNVRQLRSVLEIAVAMARTDVLRPSCLRLGTEDEEEQEDTLNLEKLEARAIREALKRGGGVHVKAARLLGI